MKLGRTIISTLSLIVVGYGMAQAQDTPLDIKIGYSSMPAHMIPAYYENKDVLRHEGKSYTVEPIRLSGSTPQITALAAGEIDIAALSPTAFVYAVQNAKLDLRVIGDIIQDGQPGHYSQTIFVRADSDIETPTDLKGKTVAVNDLGSAVDMSLRAMLKKHDLSPEKDVRRVEVSFGNVLAMLEDGKIDAGAIPQPIASQLVKEGKYRPLFSSRDAIGPTQFVFLVAKEDFLEENREAFQDFFEDHVRGFRWLSNPDNREEAVAIIAELSSRPLELTDYVFSEIDYFRDDFLFPNIEGLQLAIDTSVDLGIVEKGVQVDPDYVDLSFAEEAKRRIEADEN